MNLPILEFLFQCYFLYKRHTHFSTLSVYTVIFNPIIITWYTLYTTINCTPFYISTHLISDVENILDEVVFIKNGHIVLKNDVEDIRFNQGKSVDVLFREVFKC